MAFQYGVAVVVLSALERLGVTSKNSTLEVDCASRSSRLNASLSEAGVDQMTTQQQELHRSGWGSPPPRGPLQSPSNPLSLTPPLRLPQPVDVLIVSPSTPAILTRCTR